jgi:plasmid stability protein
MKRLTIDVTESLHRRIKVGCALKGEDMADELRRILHQHFPEPS